MSLELVPLCTATLTLAAPINVSSTLLVGELLGMAIEGERIRASLKGHAGADWLQVSPEGYGTLDVKVTLETDDNAIIHATYSGRILFDTRVVYSTPLFHTGDERYKWINRIQAVAKGTFTARDTLVYEMYELR